MVTSSGGLNRQILIGVFFVGLFWVDISFGQLQTVLPPAIGGLTSPGRVGNTSVDRQNRFAQYLRPNFSPIGMGASNLRRPAEGAFLSLAGRSRSMQYGVGAARSQGRQMSFGLLSGAGPRVTKFSPISNNGVSFTALNEFYQRRNPRRRMTPTEMLLAYPEYNIRSNAFLAPVQLAITGSGVDTSIKSSVASSGGRELASIDVESPEIPLEFRLSHVEALELHVLKSRNNQLSKAWDAFKEKDYLRAEMYFETVANMDRKSIPAKIGKFLSHLAQRQFTQAAKLLEGMTIRQQDMFANRPDLSAIFASLDEARIIGSRCDRYAKDNPSNPEAYVNLLYYLWLTGYDNDAEQVAINIQSNFPDTSYARLAYFYVSKKRSERMTEGDMGASYWIGGPAAAAATSPASMPGEAP